MDTSVYFPTEALKPFVKNYRIIKSEEERVNRLLPDTCLVMAFRLKGEVNHFSKEEKLPLPPLVISGLRKSVRLVNYEKSSGNLLVIFHEAGASAFFKEPLHELFEASVSLDHFMKTSQYDQLTEELSEAEDNAARIQLIEEFLLSRLLREKMDTRILSAIRQIQASKGSIRMKSLAEFLCLSQDAFEKRFRKAVGTSPKYFSSIVRMRGLIQTLPSSVSFTEAALEAGFTDQSHFNREFKIFTGQTPSAFFKEPVFW